MADLVYTVGKRANKRADGTLSWSAKNLTVTAVSGPYGDGALPSGSYKGKVLLDKNGQAPYSDKKGKGWMLVFEDAHGRTELGIHPDGNVEGTEGCIGLEIDDSKAWYDALLAVHGKITCDVVG